LQQMTVADFLQTALVCAQINAHGCAADGYIQAAQKSEFDPAALPDDINDLIWEHLSRARRGPSVFTHQIHHAWWLLQQQLRAADSASSQVNAWRTWKVDNPDHPAHLNPPQALALLEDYRLPNIGVLLPLSGPLASAGQALQNGLVSAYLAERNTQKPNVAFYDCAANDLSAVFETALNDGIDVLVGPLVKENVERFAMIAEAAQVPTLLLNYLADDSTSYRYVLQLGIAIEDEANTLRELYGIDKRLADDEIDDAEAQRLRDEMGDVVREKLQAKLLEAVDHTLHYITTFEALKRLPADRDEALRLLIKHKNQVVAEDAEKIDLSVVTVTLEKDDSLLENLGLIMERKDHEMRMLAADMPPYRHIYRGEKLDKYSVGESFVGDLRKVEREELSEKLNSEDGDVRLKAAADIKSMLALLNAFMKVDLPFHHEVRRLSIILRMKNLFSGAIDEKDGRNRVQQFLRRRLNTLYPDLTGEEKAAIEEAGDNICEGRGPSE